MFWDPYEEMKKIQEDMDRIFWNLSKLEKSKLLEHHGERMPIARMAVFDARETETGVIASFELPGVEKKDIELNISEHDIEVKVNKKQEYESKEKNKSQHEYMEMSFYRKVNLPAEVAPEKAVAVYKDGLLRVEIPKTQKHIESKKRIQIK